MNADGKSSPIFPRRAVIAAAFSALIAGSAVGFGIIGGMTAVQSDVFQFSRGLAFATGEEARLRGVLASALKDDRLYVTVLAHTGDAGDVAANLDLSQDRADLVMDMARQLGLDETQITAQGLGGGAPLPKLSDESDRAYQVRLARVEVSLQVRK